MRAVICGTGGFGDNLGDPCLRPGFVLARICGQVLEYWRVDAIRCDDYGHGDFARKERRPRLMEYCRIFKDPLGKHTTHEMLLDVPLPHLLDPGAGDNEIDSVRTWYAPFEHPWVMGRWRNINWGGGIHPYQDHLVHIGLGRVLQWRSDHGDYVIRILDKTTNWKKVGFVDDADHQNWCDPLYAVDRSGNLHKDAPECPEWLDGDQYRLVYLGPSAQDSEIRYLLVWHRPTGKYWIYKVGPSAKLDKYTTHISLMTVFKLAFKGTWTSRKDLSCSHELMYIGQVGGANYVLAWLPASGEYRVWKFATSWNPTDDPFVNEDGTTDILNSVEGTFGFDGPHQRPVALTDSDLILIVEKWSGRARFVRWYKYEPGMMNPFAQGFRVDGPDTRLSAFQDETEVVDLGASGVLSWDPRSGRYSIRKRRAGW